MYEIHLQEKEAGIIKAMVLGEKSGMDKEVKELYQSLQADKKFENCRFAWAVSEVDEAHITGGASVLVVQFGSSEHMQLHARAGIIVSDAPVSPHVKLRAEQNYFIADSTTKEAIRRLTD